MHHPRASQRARPAGFRLLPLVLLAAVLLSIGVSIPAVAQVAEPIAAGDTLYEVRLADGSTLFGRVVSTQGDRLTFETMGGVRVEVARAQVVLLQPARGRVVNGQFWREDPNRTRLFFTSTGRSLRAGEGYFGVYELFIPFVSYGVTDNLILSGGSPFYLGMFGVTPPIYVAPKVQVVASEQMAVSVGALAIYFPRDFDWDEERGHSAGILYGVGTFGSEDNAVTAGAGWGFVDGDMASRPMVMLGGEARTGRMTKLITENWLVSDADDSVLFYSGGVRFFGERLSADAGLIGFAGAGESSCCLPMVNFVYNFGRAR